MRAKQILRSFLLLLFLISSCSDAMLSSEPTLTRVPVTNTPAISHTKTIELFASPTPKPVMPTRTQKATATVSPTPARPFDLEELRFAFIQHGNLFIQYGSQPPRQLTTSGVDTSPIFSDDGQKLVFFRGSKRDTVYTVNVDGTGQKRIVSTGSLPVLAKGSEIKALTFRPGSHQLIFNTYLCEPSIGLYAYGTCTVSIYDADIDTGVIQQELSGLNGHTGQSDNFAIASDGWRMSVSTTGRVILGTAGIPYWPDNFTVMEYPITVGFEFLPRQYWLPDSSGLIVVTAGENDDYEPGSYPTSFMVWRWMEGDDKAVPLFVIGSFVMGCDFSISPDRNWIIPGGGLKNLNTGDEPPIDTSWNCPSTIDDLPLWSPNSLYFAWPGDDIMRTKSSIEAVDGTPVSIDGKFLTWLDGNHYLYETGGDAGLKRMFIAMVNGESVEVPHGFQWTPGYVMWSPADR